MRNIETGKPYHNENGVKQITLYLAPESMSDLGEIKNYYGIKNNTEVMRFIIRKEVRQLRAQPALPGIAQEAK